MSFEGTIVNGTVVFDMPPPLPDGTRVDVVAKPEQPPAADDPSPAGPEPRPRFQGLLRLAGRIKDMPADFAAEHDHYIHGTPRRTPKAGA